MTQLYPLKFHPRFKQKIWGGDKIRTILNKNFGNLPNCGESWEISGLQQDISVVANGFLKDNNLQEIIEVYMGDLVGDSVYKRFGIEFPLLIKFIDANDELSIQVHPNDEMAKKRHNARGKTEMWYVIEAEQGAKLISGFNREVNRKEYLQAIENKTLPEILNYEAVKPGDVFFIPAGRVHAIGKGILLAEIQQTSDVTYRIYDYDRPGTDGKPRELHTELALDAIDYGFHEKYKTRYKAEKNKSSQIVECPFFTTNLLEFDKDMNKEYNRLDSFVVYICLEGKFSIQYAENQRVSAEKGETILLPAVFESIILRPEQNTKLLEVFISEKTGQKKT